MDAKSHRASATPTMAFKYWLHELPSLQLGLRATAKAQAEANPTGPHKDALYDLTQMTKQAWECLPEELIT